MASVIAQTSALDSLLMSKRRRGRDRPDVEITELSGLGQYQVRAMKGQSAQLAKRIATHFGRKTPLSALEGAGKGVLFITATGPEEYWVITDKPANSGTIAEVAKLAGTQASVFDQGHARCVVRVAGEKSRDVLAKGMPLDLANPKLPPAWAAHTMIEHIPALIIKRGGKNTYDVSFARSYASSFTHWLMEAAREFDVAIPG